MSNEIDDDDAFLYGSEDEGDAQVSKKQKLESTTQDQKESTTTEKGESKEDSNEEEGDEEDGDSDSDSDSDIEFIIGSEEPKTTTNTTQEAQTQQSGTSAAPSTSGVTVPETIDEITDTTQTEAPIGDSSNQATTTDATITRIPGIDINKVGEFEGKPITSINLQDLKEKPWRQPGADVSEYFNYGFDEFTWTAYCSKQDKLRSDFNPQKVMMSMMPMGMPPIMMGMPGFQMPPGGQMPQIPQGPQQQQQQQPQVPPPPPQGLPSQPQQMSGNEKTMPLNPNLPKAPRERDPRDRMERENSWGQNDGNNYRDRERRNRGRR